MRSHRLLGGPLLLLAAMSATVLSQGRQVEWRYYGGDQAGTKFSPLTDITPNNVQGLQVVWQRQDAGMPAQNLALAGDRAQAEGREHDERDEPAPEIEAHRIERVAQRAAEHPVAGPQQVGEREERERGDVRARGPQRAPADRRGRRSAPAGRWRRA